MRSRPGQRSNQRTHSIARPAVFQGAEQAAAEDKRGSVYAIGKQGRGLCSNPKCGVEVTQRKVTYNNPSRNGDLPIGSLVAASHREGGGQYHARRGDVLCAGAATPVLPLPEVAETDG